MPFFELPNGKTIYLSATDLLDLTDEKLQELVAGDCGDYIENPFQRFPGGARFNTNDEVFDASINETLASEDLKHIEPNLDDSEEEKIV
jgi:hypothetical protein